MGALRCSPDSINQLGNLRMIHHLLQLWLGCFVVSPVFFFFVCLCRFLRWRQPFTTTTGALRLFEPSFEWKYFPHTQLSQFGGSSALREGRVSVVSLREKPSKNKNTNRDDVRVQKLWEGCFEGISATKKKKWERKKNTIIKRNNVCFHDRFCSRVWRQHFHEVRVSPSNSSHSGSWSNPSPPPTNHHSASLCPIVLAFSCSTEKTDWENMQLDGGGVSVSGCGTLCLMNPSFHVTQSSLQMKRVKKETLEEKKKKERGMIWEAEVWRVKMVINEK